jgi:Zn-dependent M28 family amino/carboxypeptidase
VSAHYDHLGAGDSGIYSGANDNASGVAAVLSLASAFSRETPRPRRTLVFLAFFGEEKGLLGSTWFAKHPPVPLTRIVADINFEQLGDTGSDGDVPAAALGVTGYALSDLPQLVAPALASAGVPLKDTRDNLSYFARSDNFPLAQAGIPSHTFVAAYEYPDYHRISDKWQKLNYENMARITRALAFAIESLGDSPVIPHWIESGKTKGYLDAWRAMHH